VQIDKNMKALVVDDSHSMRQAVKTVLKEMGFTNISEAEDGLQALAKLKRDRHDLLVSDWNMPNLDGIKLLSMIRSDVELKDMIVLMVTAEAESDHVVQAIKLGVTDYIVKPFTAQTLRVKIEKILGKLLRAEKGDAGGNKTTE
jgi:two-component system chemotaxis response regulator CheY